MVTEDYANACAEVVRILDYIPYKDYKKIPKDIILHYEKNANNNYNFEYDITRSLDEQNVSKTAKTIIAIFFRDYWATPEQRNKILNYEKYENIKEEAAKNEKYKINDIFEKNKDKLIENTKLNNKKNKPIVPQKQKIYKIIFEKILNFFNFK